MIKQILALVALSILIILSMVYAQQGLTWIVSAHDWVSNMLTSVFSGSQTGDLIRKLIALLIVPLVIGLVPVIVYWFARRSWFPYFMQIVWVVWLLETAALIVQYKVIT